MERAWMIVAGCCLFVAGLFLWRGHVNGAFVAGTLGAVGWFLSLRDQLKQKIVVTEDSTEDENENDALGEEDEE
jgi:hypothetical protein